MDGSPVEGCITPCLEGSPGYRDGPFKFSKFQYPYNIAIQIDSGNKTLSRLIVTDRHFIRQLDLSSHQVTTIAGQLTEGESDGQVCRIIFYFNLFKSFNYIYIFNRRGASHPFVSQVVLLSHRMVPFMCQTLYLAEYVERCQPTKLCLF